MKVNGSETKCTEAEEQLGQINVAMRVSIRTIRSTDMEYSNGLMVVNMLDHGKMESSMVLEHFLNQLEKLGRENGLKEEESDG